MTSNGLEQEQRLSLQVYESHIYVYDEINLYEQLILHFSLSLTERKLNFDVFLRIPVQEWCYGKYLW